MAYILYEVAVLCHEYVERIYNLNRRGEHIYPKSQAQVGSCFIIR